MANIDFNFCTNGQWSRNGNGNSWGNENGNKNRNKQANRIMKTEQTWLFSVSFFFFFVTVVVVALALTTKCTWISIRRSVSASIGSYGSCLQLDNGTAAVPLLSSSFWISDDEQRMRMRIDPVMGHCTLCSQTVSSPFPVSSSDKTNCSKLQNLLAEPP